MNEALADLINQEQDALLVYSEQWKEPVELATDAWQLFFTPNYLNNLHPNSQLVVAYKAQADGALGQAILSVIRSHHAQATSRIRFALENIIIALAILVEPDTLTALFMNRERATTTTDVKIKTKAYAIVKEFNETLSAEIKQFKDTLSANGSHQSAGLLANNFQKKQERFATYLLDLPNPALTAATLGFVPETVMLFHPHFVAAGKLHGLVTVTSDAIATVPILRARTDAFKNEVRFLFRDLATKVVK
jgi:hypothetical protein